jgi:L-amino acid N-acyltransferase
MIATARAGPPPPTPVGTIASVPGPPVVIRLAGPPDSEAIRAIYNAEVLGSTNTFDLRARTPAEQDAWLDAHQGAHPAVVAVGPGPDGATGDGVVVGFGSLSPYRDRPAYATTVENSVYVDPTWRGRGVGRLILTELLELAVQHGFHSVIARIVGHNETSIALHHALGFEMVGTEHEVGRKHRRWLDVVELERLV